MRIQNKFTGWLTIGLLASGLCVTTVSANAATGERDGLQHSLEVTRAKLDKANASLESKGEELAQVSENMQGVVAELDTVQARYNELQVKHKDLQSTYDADMEVVVAAEASTSVLECQLERMTNAADAELQAFEYIMSAWSASDAGNESSAQDLIDRASTAADEAVTWRDLSPCNV